MDLGVAVSQIPTGGGAATEVYRNDFGYDAIGRFSSITFAGKKATYGYWPQVNSLIGSITFGEAMAGGSTLTLSSAYDSLGRLQTRSARVNGASPDITSLQYPAFDHMNRRKTIVRSEPLLGGSTAQSSNWDYSYNARGEVQTGTKRAGATGGKLFTR